MVNTFLVLAISTALHTSAFAGPCIDVTKNQTLVTEVLATLPLVGLDLPAAGRFGRLKVDLERDGNILADADLMIAAITQAQGASLVTGKLRHYARIGGLRVEDWLRGDT